MNLNLNHFRVKEIRFSSGIYKLGHPADIMDEGSFYRIDGTFIIDKYKIRSMTYHNEQITIRMDDQDIILVVEQKK